ncbi:MAG: hypothetical protein KKA68_21155 [Gammaproteobacteria bacterium]|nr:hypothetical protein [Gammaproteobacteria bacterium]
MWKINDIDIVSLISQTGVELTQQGDIYSGLCPLHNDKDTPSLKVYPHNSSWCCFGTGCGNKAGKLNGGTAIDWIEQRFNLTYSQAKDWIEANYKGKTHIDLPKLRVASKPKIVPPNLVTYWHGLLDMCERRKWFHGRGFEDAMIDREMFGWDGIRYVIPVWDDEPSNSNCLGVRLRKSELDTDAKSPKYRGFKDHNAPVVWGKYYCKGRNLILGFAGELDAARAVQDGFAAFSVVNGVNAMERFPENWPDLWFPDSKYLIVVFDKKEEFLGGRLAKDWNKKKGSMMGRVVHWPPQISAKDYNEFRDSGKSSQEFWDLLSIQVNAPRNLAKVV